MKRQFEFSAGALALDFIDTVAGRTGDAVDLIDGAPALARWLALAGVADHLAVGEEELAEARALREAAHDTLAAAASGEALPEAAIAVLNRRAAAKDFRPEYRGGRLRMVSDDPFAAALSCIAADALGALGADRIGRLRRCPDCRMLFQDNSPPGRRKWCSSASGCGNRAKVRRHRAKHASGKDA